MKKIEWWWLVLILVLGIFLRFWQLGETPKGFYLDEAALGYNAFSVMNTGKDEYGMKWPLLFRSFGDFKAPVYTYLLIPMYKLIGMSVWSTRVLSALAGVIIVWLSFWLVKNLSKNTRLAVIVALLVAISPWQIIFSRTSYETNVSLMFLLIMIWSFYKSEKNKKWLILTALMAGLSFLTYHSERVVTPLILLCLVIKERKNIFKKENIVVLSLAVLLGLVLVLPTVKLMTTPGFLSRLNSLSILSGEVKKPWGFNDGLKGGKNLMFNNSFELKFREFASLYTSYFSPRYLFGLGDPGPRSSYPDLAPFLGWQLPFWIAGLVWLWKRSKTREDKKFKFLIVLMILVSPIPAAITRDPFSSIRALPLTWPLIILTAIGIEVFLKKFKNLGKIMLVFLVVWSLGKIYLSVFKFNDYFRGYAWEEGIEEMIDQIKTEKLPIVIDNARGEIYSQVLFFTQAEPQKYQEENFEVNKENYYIDMNRNKVKKIGNISVRPIRWDKDIYEQQILVGDGLSINEEQIAEHCLTVLFEVKDREGKILFRGVKTHPKEKFKFDIGNKVNGKIVKGCVVTTP